jgi:cytochrome c oxidase subunit 2
MNRPMHHLRRLFAKFSITAGWATASVLAGTTMLAGAAWAQTADKFEPQPWQLGMQPPGSPVALAIDQLHDVVNVIIIIITLMVAGLLGWVMYRFSARRNPIPSQTAHHTLLEVAWTALPVLILVGIAIPSFRLVYYEDRTHDADMTLKVTAHQWYWEYTYVDHGNIDFASRFVADEDLKPGQPRLLTADEQLVLPTGKNIRILTTSADVIHSFFIPSLGVQRYAIPGRTIETWVRIDKPGVYYGECNQICGTDHSKMPIDVRGVTPAEFTAWVAMAKKKYAVNQQVAPPVVAALPPTMTLSAKLPAPLPAPVAVAEIQH